MISMAGERKREEELRADGEEAGDGGSDDIETDILIQ